MMTDEELAQAGERLYASLLLTDLSVFEIGGLTAAIRTRTQWTDLAPGLKVAVFRIVANAQHPDQARGTPPAADTKAGAPAAASAPATEGPAQNASPPPSPTVDSDGGNENSHEPAGAGHAQP